jgi:hypothetical protein
MRLLAGICEWDDFVIGICGVRTMRNVIDRIASEYFLFLLAEVFSDVSLFLQSDEESDAEKTLKANDGARRVRQEREIDPTSGEDKGGNGAEETAKPKICACNKNLNVKLTLHSLKFLNPNSRWHHYQQSLSPLPTVVGANTNSHCHHCQQLRCHMTLQPGLCGMSRGHMTVHVRPCHAGTLH